MLPANAISPSPATKALIVVSGVLVALLFGLVGGMFGFEVQLLLIIVAVPAAILVLDPRVALALFILMMPYNGSTLPYIPRIAQNAVILGVPALFAARMAFRIAAGQPTRIELPRELMFYVAVMVTGVAIGYTHLGEIDPFLLMRLADEDRSFGFKEYVIGFFGKQMMLVALAVMISSMIADKGRGEWVVGVALASGVLFVFAMLALLIGSGMGFDVLGSSRTVFIELGRHSNTIGALLAPLVAVALFVRETAASTRMKMLMLGVLSILLLGVLLTASRGAFMAVVVVFAVYILQFRRIRVAFMAVLILVVGVFAAPESVQERLVRGLDSRSIEMGPTVQAGDALSSGRFDIWMQLAPEVTRNPIVGNGLQSTMWSHFLRYGRNYGVQHPHNMYLEAALDHGLVGLICLFLLFRYWWRLFRSLEAEPRLGPTMHGVVLAGPAILLTVLTYGLTNGHFYPSTDQLFFWLFAGVALGYQKWLKDQPPAVSPTPVASTRARRR